MHALWKILAHNANREAVEAGEIITASVDLAEVNDLYLQVIHSFYEMEGTHVWDPEKVAFVFDHYSPSPTIKASENHKKMRTFCREQGIGKLFDINKGVCHQVMPEAGLVYPGMLLVATDSHTTTHGAFGAFGTGVGATDLANILLDGTLWFRVPEVIKIELTGKMSPSIMAKDIILHILGTLGQAAAVYKAIEFCGPIVDQLNMDERMVLCNMTVELGAKTAYIAPDDITKEYLNTRVKNEYKIYESDPDFHFSETYTFDVTELTPIVAKPHSVDNCAPLSETKQVQIDQVLVGTCTGGRLNDIAKVAAILQGKRIADHVRLIVIPASDEVMKNAIKYGYIQQLMDSGATISTPGCGPCLGAHEGLLASGETCVTTSSRNFPGRMGSKDARIYSASPATAAYSALYGKLTGGAGKNENY